MYVFCTMQEHRFPRYQTFIFSKSLFTRRPIQNALGWFPCVQVYLELT